MVRNLSSLRRLVRTNAFFVNRDAPPGTEIEVARRRAWGSGASGSGPGDLDRGGVHRLHHAGSKLAQIDRRQLTRPSQRAHPNRSRKLVEAGEIPGQSGRRLATLDFAFGPSITREVGISGLAGQADHRLLDPGVVVAEDWQHGLAQPNPEGA